MKKYQIVILAAGLGSRMGKYVKSKPKTLVKVNGKPLIEFILNSLNKKFCSDILIAVGYKKDKIIKLLGHKRGGMIIKYVFNPLYKTTNSTYSMWLLSSFFKKNIVVINADTIFDKDILKFLIKSKHKNALSVDDHIEIPLPDEAMKVTLNKKSIITNVSKKISANKTSGDAIGIYKFDKEGLYHLKKELFRLIKKNNTKHLFTYAVNNILKKINIFSVSTKKRKWIEIDDKNDLMNAKKLFKI